MILLCQCLNIWKESALQNYPLTRICPVCKKRGSPINEQQKRMILAGILAQEIQSEVPHNELEESNE
jgi:hypothetical protein